MASMWSIQYSSTTRSMHHTLQLTHDGRSDLLLLLLVEVGGGLGEQHR